MTHDRLVRSIPIKRILKPITDTNERLSTICSSRQRSRRSQNERRLDRVRCYESKCFPFVIIVWRYPLTSPLRYHPLSVAMMFFFILFNYTILRDTKDVLMITAKGSGAEVIPFIKTYVNLPVSSTFNTAILTGGGLFPKNCSSQHF